MSTAKHLTTQELETGLDEIRRSPREAGPLKLIVRRPQTEQRELLEEGELSPEEGLVGDNWSTRGRPDRPLNPETQLTLMNARVISLVAREKARWPLAGDQLFIDLDLSAENLPPGTRLALGTAVLEVTAVPHTGCKKFVSRYGMDAMNFVNSPEGKQMNLRGIYTKVVQPGVIRVGDTAKKI